MRSLKNTHKWLDSINEERRGLIKNLKRIEKRLDLIQHKEDRLVKDLEALVKQEHQFGSSGEIENTIQLNSLPQGSGISR
tara:strand:- start:52 stop:291 length:240 start_codon:yes stop_codon:yes gene_type:complete